ncbi:hypothetical protein CC86DRAFT_400393 [Ophiobolus disseminans]|uniref:Uncharacterized protein n=1 Tax=Ophiobolus disseminans TaxID=1469910 RepID=A0A6A7ALC4_9PLEO|nr:hypothetical protein CC86DRAFT_400393 [Ophiobolus disseminans]
MGAELERIKKNGKENQVKGVFQELQYEEHGELHITGSENTSVEGKVSRVQAAMEIILAGDPFKALSRILQRMYRDEEREIAAAILARSIQISETLYDRTKFNFGKVFMDHSKRNENSEEVRSESGWSADYTLSMNSDEESVDSWEGIGRDDPFKAKYGDWGPFRLETAFVDSYNTTAFDETGGDLGFSEEVLKEEVKRHLRGHSLFTYNLDGGDAPGIAFGRVEEEDYVFRPYRCPSFDYILSDVALVLR